MNIELGWKTAPYRDARYAPRALDVQRRDDGSILLSNPRSFPMPFETLTAPLKHWAVAAPDRIWLAERSGDGWRKVTYAEGAQMVAALAGGLRQMGVVGERPLLILARNGVGHALITYAAMGQGMPIAPVSPQYGLPGAHLSRLNLVARTLNPVAVYTEDAELFATGLGAEALSGLPVIAAANPRPGDVSLESLLRASPVAATARPADHAKYMLTSGSTGDPKAVITTHLATCTNASQLTACYDDPDPPVVVNGAPWSHALGANSVLHLSTHRGGTLYIDMGQPTAGRFGETLRNLREISPTSQNMVPAGWMLFAEALETDDALARRFFERVRVLQYGGAILDQVTNDRIQAVAVRTVGERITFYSGYGSTETGPTASNVHWHTDRMGMIGLPIPGTQVKLTPEDDKLEFRVKGPQVCLGYLGQPELSARAFDEEGFYRLGDAVRFVDPEDPMQGLAFDGRLSENFKLASGIFVNVGGVRVAAISTVGGAVTDAVVCGEGREAIGLLFYPNPTMSVQAVEMAVRTGIELYNAVTKGSSGRVSRAIVLPDAPDAASGEITDKGYISQATARRRRAEAIEMLFADPAPASVLTF